MSMGRVERFARDVVALGQEWEVPATTTAMVLAVQLLAMEAGCASPDVGLAWSVEQGFMVRRVGVPEDDPHAYEITAEGQAAARRRLGVSDSGGGNR